MFKHDTKITNEKKKITVTLPCFLHSLTVIDGKASCKILIIACVNHEITVSSRKRREMTRPAGLVGRGTGCFKLTCCIKNKANRGFKTEGQAKGTIIAVC